MTSESLFKALWKNLLDLIDFYFLNNYVNVCSIKIATKSLASLDKTWSWISEESILFKIRSHWNIARKI